VAGSLERLAQGKLFAGDKYLWKVASDAQANPVCAKAVQRPTKNHLGPCRSEQAREGRQRWRGAPDTPRRSRVHREHARSYKRQNLPRRWSVVTMDQ